MRRASISLPMTLLIGAAVIALVVVGAWWAVPSRAELSAAASRLAAVPPGWLVLAGVLALAPTAVEAVRVWLVARGFGARVPVGAAIDAAAANSFFTAITPAAGLGEPAVAWVLRRRAGVERDVAMAVPLAKFTTSFVAVFVAGAVTFALGGGPPRPWLRVTGAIACAVAALVMLAVIALARRPALARRALAWLGRRGRFASRFAGNLAVHALPSLERMAALPARTLALLGLAHAVYFTAYILPLAIVCEALAPGTGATALPRALAYLCATFLAPTPGGAGVAEASAAAFFGDLIGRADAVIAVIAFRVARFVAQVVVCGALLAVRGVTAGRDER
jgi:uncharacterized protein (TIRG00374 family)